MQVSQLVLFSEYNQLMNQRQYQAASKLSTVQLNEDKGAFFKSVIGTLNHILVGDIVWLKRFAKCPPHAKSLSVILEMEVPKGLSTLLFSDLGELQAQRDIVDSVIVDWVSTLSEADLAQCVSYKNMAGTNYNKPLLSLINHLFLHQVHHRGQVTTLLSQFGIDFGETDLIEIIDDCAVH